MKLLWICLGGALGTAARYLLSGWALQVFGTSFPYGTLSVNVIGSFLIGFINYLGFNSELLSPTLRIALTTGVMGGFTTYSSFNYETLQYFQEGIWWMGFFNLFVMIALCLAAGLLGFFAAKGILAHS